MSALALTTDDRYENAPLATVTVRSTPVRSNTRMAVLLITARYCSVASRRIWWKKTSPKLVVLTRAMQLLPSRLRSPSEAELIPLICTSPCVGSRCASGCWLIPWNRLGIE